MRRFDVSVIIPVYNGAETIKDALNSVLRQTALRYVQEVIVVDDGSTDDTVKTVLDWKEKNSKDGFKLILIELKENRGVSVARNKGSESSAGNYIAFLDADDEWLPEKLEVQLCVLKKHPKIKVLGTGWDQLNLKPGRKIAGCNGYGIYAMTLRSELIYFWPSTQSLLIEKSELLKVGGFDESMKYAEDGDLLCRLSERGTVYYVSDELVMAGHGKNTFGEKGLSSDLCGMHKGFKKTVKGCFDRGSINAAEYVLFILWENIKYIRRVWISGRIKELKKKGRNMKPDPLSALKRFAKIMLALYRMIKHRTFLKNIEFQIIDHCNLNCRGCAHFSNISEKKFIDARVMVKSMDQFNKRVGYVYSVALMGGEPLLHPDIVDIIEYTRDRFPISEVRIVTNGLLLDRMPQEFYKACRKNRILIYISKYPPTVKKIPKIKKILSHYGIRYFISSTVRQFSSCFEPTGTSDARKAFEHCGRRACTIVKDDRIYLCSICAFVDKYNKRFVQDIPQPEGLNLYTCSAKELMDYLKSPAETCKYCACTPHYLDWSCFGEPDRSDWYGRD